MYLLPVKTEMDFRKKNSIPEITNLLRYWTMLEISVGKALEEDYLNVIDVIAF